MSAITNAIVDAKIASDNRPVTRVTDVDSLVSSTDLNGSSIKLEFLTNTYGTTVYASFDELDNDTIWERLYAGSVGYDVLINTLNTKLQAITTAIAALTAPYSWDDYRDIVNMMINDKDVFRFVRGRL